MDRASQRAALKDLMSVRDIAEKLKISRQRVDQLTHREDFPKIAATLSGTRFWFKGDVVEFEKIWDRTPGRRRLSEERSAARSRAPGPPSVENAYTAGHPENDEGAAAPSG